MCKTIKVKRLRGRWEFKKISRKKKLEIREVKWCWWGEWLARWWKWKEEKFEFVSYDESEEETDNK